MTRVIHGKVHGRTIELAEDLDLADGEEVEVQVKVHRARRKGGDGPRRCAGALADDPEWDAIMGEIYRERKHDPRREILQ